MNRLRKILFPFSLLYGFIIWVRNWLYDKEVKKTTSFSIPLIAVGNLSVGGTGKTPMIEYLISLLKEDYILATLSRGYKRKSTGFVLANKNTKVEDIGDEPYQYFTKFEDVAVAVNADRVEGVRNIMKIKPEVDVILLDDAFQHRKIKAGFYILLTSYESLYCNDFLLPMGNLREHRKGAKRADCVVVTKCPAYLSAEEQLKMQQKLQLTDKQQLYFSCIEYDNKVYQNQSSILLNSIDKKDIIALAGIAKPQYFYDYLEIDATQQLTYPDHHHFSQKDIEWIKKKSQGKVLITTEKDYMRLKHLEIENMYYLPISIRLFPCSEKFDETIRSFVEQKKMENTL